MRWKHAFIILCAVLLCSAAIVAFVLHLGHTQMPGSSAMQTSHGSHGKQKWQCSMDHIIRDEPGECPVCHMALTPIWLDETGGADTSGRPDVRVDPAVLQNMGVRTAIVTHGPLARTIRAVGILSIPDPGMHEVNLKVAGWVEKLYADHDGMHVAAGDPLLELYGPDLQLAEQELIAAVGAEKSLDPAAGQELRQQTKALVDSAKNKLRLWDIADLDIDAIARADRPPRRITFRSPASGHIEEKSIVEGSAVQPGMKLMRIADHAKMWLEAQVPEDALPSVRNWQEVMVTATIDAIPATTFKGTIDFTQVHIDHMTRTLTVRTTLDNANRALKPGMYAAVEIHAPLLADAIQIPREAVIDTGSRQVVFVVAGEGHFSPRDVRMGAVGEEGRVQIIEGLSTGQVVVTSGQFLLDVESRTIEAARKLNTPSPSGNPTASPSTIPSTTGPATTQNSPAGILVVAYCPMAKADWIQRGDAIMNPYMGKRMPTCGNVQKMLAEPAPDSPLLPLVKHYLAIQQKLDADTLDAREILLLKEASQHLAAQYADLKKAVEKLAEARDIEVARDEFKRVSAALVIALGGADVKSH